MELVKGKNVLITGGSRGIGAGIAGVFAQQGANVAFTYQSSESAAKDLEKSLAEYGTTVKSFKSDASYFDQAEQLVENVLNEFPTVDILINNAGITKDGLLMRMTEEDFDKVIEVNLKSVFNMTKAVQKVMLKQRSGSIINMGSVVGSKGNAGQANYAASKAAIIGFSKSVAQEFGSRGIRCNVIAPGFIETEMTQVLDKSIIEQWVKQIPLKRSGTTQDIANACLYLASNLSNYVTGQVIHVNGGML